MLKLLPVSFAAIALAASASATGATVYSGDIKASAPTQLDDDLPPDCRRDMFRRVFCLPTPE